MGSVTYGGGATTLTLVLLSNDAVISGTLKLNESPISGVKGDVFAVSGDGGWEETSIGHRWHLQLDSWLQEIGASAMRSFPTLTHRVQSSSSRFQPSQGDGGIWLDCHTGLHH